jgi:hypothetical protein
MPGLKRWVERLRYKVEPSAEFPRANDMLSDFYEALRQCPELAHLSKKEIAALVASGVLPHAAFVQLCRIYPSKDFWEMVTAAETASQEVVFEVFGERGRWFDVANYLLDHRAELTASALEWYGIELVSPGFPLLARREWRLDRPLDLREIELVDDAGRAERAPPRALIEYPIPLFYSSILRAAKSDEQDFEDWDCYRLLDVRPQDSGELVFEFGHTNYFDFIDTHEVLAAEMADAVVRGCDPPFDLPLRINRDSAFAFSTRNAVPGLNVFLVLRNYRASPDSDPRDVFLLHDRRRGSTVEGRALHVAPAGTFQPFASLNAKPRTDFSLFRSIARELLEELFGLVNATRPTSDLSDPLDSPAMRRVLSHLQDDTTTTLKFLGLGLDPVNLKPEMLFFLSVDCSELTERYGLSLTANSEGTLTYLELTRAQVRTLSKDWRMLPAGAACMKLVDDFWEFLFHDSGKQ